MQATRSSKYSMTPLNVSEVRKGDQTMQAEADVGLSCQNRIGAVRNRD